MKVGIVIKSLILGLALTLASGAFAATKGTLELNRPVIVNGTELKAGVYKIQWEGSGSNMVLSIMQGKAVLAKVPAHLIAHELPAANDAAVTRENGNGSDSLVGVLFQGKKVSLELGEGSASADAVASAK
jgi:hypothetical protein